MADLFAGAAAVVTGGDSGIGAACVEALVAAGAKVALTYHSDHAAADAVVERCGGRERALAVQADVGDEAAVETLFAAAEQAFGPVTLLVNSAGLNMSGVKLVKMELGQFERVLKTDLYGPFLTCRRFARPLVAAGKRGRIVNVSSIHEQAPRPGAVDYDAAKGGLAQLTRTLALELAPNGIAVNGVAPGMILTPMNERALEDAAYRRELEGHIPWGRAGRPEEVAELVRYLLSSAADYITGATVTIDGALSLCIAQDA
ncbi:MAG: SDR family oxidoreductase [Porphyrobacter sp.]|nr:SDR family oxidoreductase [Porphyrobacter sp.]